jgi:polyribonucleotide nucleotidyltransferase
MKKKVLYLILSLILFSGIELRAQNDFEIAKNVDIFVSILKELNLKYADEITPGDLVKNAIDGMLNTLDPYSVYYPESQIAEPRKEVSKYAPKTVTFMINPDRIKEVIGKGGETITKIILESSNVKAVNDVNAVKVDLEDDGRVIIYHTSQEIIDKTKEMILNIVREPETDALYTVKVVKVEDFGAFVQLWPGCEGLVHVSQLDVNRVEKPSDIVKVGDEIVVKNLGYDNKGRLNLSRKAAMAPAKSKEEPKEKETNE